jgi:hypothetical protein
MTMIEQIEYFLEAARTNLACYINDGDDQNAISAGQLMVDELEATLKRLKG